LKRRKNAFSRNVARNTRKKDSIAKNVRKSNMKASSDRHIVFSTLHTSLAQDDRFEGYCLIIDKQEYSLDRHGYSLFRKNIKSIDFVTLLSSKTPDLEIVRLINNDNFLVVNIHLAIELKELIAGASAMFELNTCIHKGIRRKALHA